MSITQSTNNPQLMGFGNQADIIFIIDSSGSMRPCYDGVKKHIRVFVEELTMGVNIPIDYRLGLISAGILSFQMKNFTESVKEFKEAISNMDATGGNEFTLPALDMAMDYEFRENAHKVIILFSDEPVSGGSEVSFQLSKLVPLIDKGIALHVKFFIFAPDCDTLKRIANDVPGSSFTDINKHKDFFSSDFSKVLKQIGKTVSSSCGSFVPGQMEEKVVVKRDLYHLCQRGKPEIIEVR